MRSPHRAASRLAVAAVALFMVIGCADRSTPSVPTSLTVASPPAVGATSSPTPSSAERTPKPSLPPDGASGLRMGGPYVLVRNPANARLTGTLDYDVGGRHVHETISGREIWRDGRQVGLVQVVQVVGARMNDAIFQGGVRQAADAAHGTLSYTTILDTRVALITTSAGTVALFPRSSDFIVVVGIDPADTEPIVTWLIISNTRSAS